MGVLPPGPIGTDHKGLNTRYWHMDRFGFLTALARTYGDVVSFDLGGARHILVNGREEVRELLFSHEKHLRKPDAVADSNRGHWGNGLTTLEGAAWQARRAMLRPLYMTGTVARRLEFSGEFTQDMLARWTPGAVFDLWHETRILTARIAVRLVLGADVEGHGSRDPLRPVVPFGEAYGEDQGSATTGEPAADTIMIRPRAAQRMDATVAIIDQHLTEAQVGDDILSELTRARLPSGEKLSRDDIVSEVMQLLFAGHLTIPFCLVSLWRTVAGGEAEARIETEADKICESGLPSAAILASSYTVAAMRESMRLNPPAPILYREVAMPFDLGGFAFPRGVGVWICPWILHRDARYFADPMKFDPMRFLRGGLSRDARSAYFPFGAGPRVCIASQQAILQMSLVAILAARRFRLKPVPDDPRRFEIAARTGASRQG